MSMRPGFAGVTSFAAGAASAAALMYLYQKMRAGAPEDRRATRGDHGATTHGAPSPAPVPATATPGRPLLLDSPALDQRMLRKAEGALRQRTSRLIVVVERCTNDHNYSAILRTVERSLGANQPEPKRARCCGPVLCEVRDSLRPRGVWCHRAGAQLDVDYQRPAHAMRQVLQDDKVAAAESAGAVVSWAERGQSRV